MTFNHTESHSECVMPMSVSFKSSLRWGGGVCSISVFLLDWFNTCLYLFLLGQRLKEKRGRGDNGTQTPSLGASLPS